MQPTTDPSVEQARALLQARLADARANGAAAAISAMFAHLGLAPPLLVCKNALRDEQITYETNDLSAYLSPEATAALDTVAALVKDYGPQGGPNPPALLYEDENTAHYVMPSTGRGTDPLDQAGAFDV